MIFNIVVLTPVAQKALRCAFHKDNRLIATGSHSISFCNSELPLELELLLVWRCFIRA